jgi:hypothetical protein
MRGWWIAAGVLLIVACGASGTDNGGSGGGSAAGGSSASGGSGGGLSLDGGAASGGSAPLGDSACATAAYDGERLPLDMYIVFDRSGSMDTDTGTGSTLWNATKQAFIDYINSPDSVDVGVGLQFFPPGSGSGANCFGGVPPSCPPGCIPFVSFCVPAGDEGCNVNDYLPPAVVIQPLPGVGPALLSALNGTSPGGGTPTVPAMQAAATAVPSYASNHPDRKVIVVLATDGNPNDCNSDIGGVANIAAGLASGNPGVDTFVIGINNSGVNTAGLDQIAAAGNTNKALIVDPANAGAEFLAAMKAIQGVALGCSFAMPKPKPGENLNPTQVNVWFTPQGGSETIIYKVAGAASCDPNLGGWYYDNPTSPTEIVLCPKSCEAIGGSKGKIRIELGCTTIEIPE